MGRVAVRPLPTPFLPFGLSHLSTESCQGPPQNVECPHLDTGPYIHNPRYMESTHAIEIFAALSQPTRLDTFRLLMEHEPEGLPAGEIARRLGVPQNTMSSHLAILTRAGLIESERHSRSIVYRAVVDRVREITSFLVQDCCGGRPELCEPLVRSEEHTSELQSRENLVC